MNNRKYYLLNYIFILGIVLLFLNDHFFKWQYSNWITGKLSDFIGLLIFPFFLTFLFPKSLKWNVIITGLFFVFWKLPYSQGFIDFYNSIAFIEITRVVDYSDYIALSILPISYYYLNTISGWTKLQINKLNIHPIVILLPAIVVFMATSPPYWHGFKYSEGNLILYKTSINIKKSQKEILREMKFMNIKVNVDTTMSTRKIDKLSYCVVDELILDNDTIKSLRFSMASFKENKTKIYLNAMTISDDIKDADVKKELRKYYRKLLRKYVKTNLK